VTATAAQAKVPSAPALAPKPTATPSAARPPPPQYKNLKASTVLELHNIWFAGPKPLFDMSESRHYRLFGRSQYETMRRQRFVARWIADRTREAHREGKPHWTHLDSAKELEKARLRRSLTLRQFLLDMVWKT
jgi:hypothetical protein